MTIKAQSSLYGPAGKSANPTSNVEIDRFLLNISEIEFEFADDNDVFSMGSSTNSDDDLTYEQLPDGIKSYLEENYPDDPFCEGELEDDGSYKYEIELESGFELYFRSDYTLYATEESDEPCFDEDDYGNSWGGDDDIELLDPFELDLSDGAVTVVDIEIPVGVYEEVEFEMDINKKPQSDLYQKSVLIEGEISGTPFVFFHTFEEEFEIDYEDTDQNLVIDESNNGAIVFNFDLNAVVNTVDLSSAQDLNNDGTIEISPVDEDGNSQLAHDIKNAIIEYAELLDD